jgi:hypothetical protein
VHHTLGPKARIARVELSGDNKKLLEMSIVNEQLSSKGTEAKIATEKMRVETAIALDQAAGQLLECDRRSTASVEQKTTKATQLLQEVQISNFLLIYRIGYSQSGKTG